MTERVSNEHAQIMIGVMAMVETHLVHGLVHSEQNLDQVQQQDQVIEGYEQKTRRD